MKIDIETARRELELKAEFLSCMPPMRLAHNTELEYAESAVWSFDKEKYDNDPSYRDDIHRRYCNHITDVEYYNGLLDKALNAILK